MCASEKQSTIGIVNNVKSQDKALGFYTFLRGLGELINGSEGLYPGGTETELNELHTICIDISIISKYITFPTVGPIPPTSSTLYLVNENTTPLPIADAMKITKTFHMFTCSKEKKFTLNAICRLSSN